ncbi:hypothetical protein CBR_g41667 [Chara braunii]|uniref:Uncharacterized protein n=1 Tax=Chara braunii TaxID=69332 RepID=A0A388LWH2_CHABU|nr:hypothetical protein CBR_g41667 [Chara braunii]|eukprot:GBG86603.1 hypothetical protein CBR_g41667 [Chara braunii]
MRSSGMRRTSARISVDSEDRSVYREEGSKRCTILCMWTSVNGRGDLKWRFKLNTLLPGDAIRSAHGGGRKQCLWEIQFFAPMALWQRQRGLGK